MTHKDALAKVPAVTLGFWIVKILATTFGETAGDTVSMSMNLGYLIGTAIFLAILIVLVWRQIAARRYHPLLYWATIIASTTAGTTMADFATRSLGIGYAGGSALLFACVVASLAVWRSVLGSVAVETVHEPRAELFYWITITFSQTLGTALGDWTADTGGLGYGGAAVIFGAMLVVIAALYAWTAVDRVLLFWSAFILTRPLGAAVGDFLDKPVDHGGLAFSRPLASAVLAVAIVVLVLALPSQRARISLGATR
ncbi:COG4705 family protein [Sphingomonas sp. LR55]|uniref:COG4705 family protein n=1 Tax=Sphingomonas sp. LR55 TaxID=3050231 RepID=UPI002FE397F6